jgi:hypothetical protein
MEWLSINFCDLWTRARTDVLIATSDSMALRDLPRDSSVTTRKSRIQLYNCAISRRKNSGAPVRSYRGRCSKAKRCDAYGNQ